MPISAKLLTHGQLASASPAFLVFTCSFGRLAIIRDVSVAKTSGVVGVVEMGVLESGVESFPVPIARSAAAAAGDMVRLQDGFVVLEGGHDLYVFADTGGVRWWVSGHDFALP